MLFPGREIMLWIQRQIQYYARPGDNRRGEQGDLQEHELPVPALPASRPYQIELAPAQGDMSVATANSTFFQRLPPDVRRLILIEAVGDRIMHIDLQYGPPSATVHAPLSTQTALHTLRQYYQSRRWQWYGCVCHRDPEWRVRNSRIGGNTISEPKTDNCLKEDDQPSSRACDSWSGQRPSKCHVGAMGWLRTCRQA